ncbi:MAG: DUF1071 domain-containing protein [Ktedonobacteraceae bacterium]|nr:DUF1071 domain-containing protein [Ktedonobacteraceae bacterium]MBA3923424.1 DUF1071 domain-containing protein [Nostocaceae cyanobacterium]
MIPLDPSKPEWYKGFRRPITEILTDLSKPIPAKYLATRKQGGANLIYVPWYNAVKLLDRCAPGWDYSVTNVTTTSDRIFITVRLTIRASEGEVSREATGTELLTEQYFDKETKTYKIRELAYGDPSSNSESMALRRAAAKFGLGLYLYLKD